MWRPLSSCLAVLAFCGAGFAQVTWNHVLNNVDFRRSGHQVVEHNNKLWMIGGGSVASLSNVWSSTNGSTWNLERQSTAFIHRANHSAAVFQGKIWFSGGFRDGQGPNSEIWNSTDGVNWTRVVASAAFGARQYHKMFVFNNRLWVIGGEDDNFLLKNDVWNSTDGLTWTRVTAAAPFLPRSYLGVLVYNNQMWVIGGFQRTTSPPGGVSDVWRSSDGVNWTQVTTTAPTETYAVKPVVWQNRMWIFNSFGLASTTRTWSSTDGANWTEAAGLVAPGNWFEIGVFQSRVWRVGSYGTDAEGGNVHGVSGMHPLTIEATGGTVAKSPNESWFFPGDPVTLTATPTGTNIFQNWSDGATGTANPVTITMNAPKNVRANFLAQYTLALSASGPGSVSPPGTTTYLSGSQVQLTQNAQSGNHFTGWSGDLVSTDPSPTLTMNGNKTIQGNFAVNAYTLTTSVANGLGTVAKDPDQGSYPHGTQVKLSVNCQSGYLFAGWTDGNTTNPRFLNMTGNLSLTATCAPTDWRLETTRTNMWRVDHGFVSFNNALWVIGGRGPGASASYKDVWRSTDGITWTQVALNPPFQIRENFGIAVLNNRIWISGGFANGSTGHLSDVWSSADGSTWTQATASAPFGRRSSHSMVAFNSKLWVIGGENQDLQIQSDVWSSSDGITWTQVQAAPFPKREFHSVVVHQNALWVIGGFNREGGPTTLRDVWRSTNGTTWSQVTANAPFPANHVEAVSWQGKLYAFFEWDLGPAFSSADGVTWTALPRLNASMLSFKLAVHNSTIWRSGPNLAAGTWEVHSIGGLYPLTTSATTGGTVERFPPETQYLPGSQVELRAINQTGYDFTGWSGSATGTTTPITVVMDGPKSVTGNFAIKTYTVNVSVVDNNGSIIKAPNRTTYDHGTTVDLDVNCNTGYQFERWSDNLTSETRTLTMTGNVTLSATCTPNVFYTLNLSYLNGRITKGSNRTSYTHGSTETLTPVENANYTFSNWAIDGSGSAIPLTVTMDRNKTVEAIFTPVTRLLTTPPATGGSISRSLPGPQYPHGTDVDLTPVHQTGYVFVRWGGDGSGTNPTLRVKMDRAKTVTAIFAVAKVRLTINPSTNGSIRTQPNPDANGFYDYGKTVILIPVPNPVSQYKLTGWTGAATGTADKYPLIMNGDKTVSATFGLIPFYTLTLTQVPNGILKPSPPPGPNGYKEGSKVVLSAAPSANYSFGGWTGAASGTKSVTLIMNGNKTVSGSFVTAPPVTLTIIHNTGTSTRSVLQHEFTSLTTTIPADKGFSHWAMADRQTNKVAVKFANPSSATGATVRVSGGNATVKAVFLDPNLDIQVKDDATGGANKLVSKPVIQVKTLDAGALNDFKLRYYFKMECSSHPEMAAAQGNGWTVTLNDADNNGDYGGNWFLEYVYSNTLAGRSFVNTPAVTLSFQCANCNPNMVWNRNNDYSGPKKAGKWVRNGFIPVYKNSGDADPFKGQVPDLVVDPMPELVPPGENTTYPIPAPEKTDPPIPNLTFGQLFPDGDYFANGSFEHDTLGWGQWGGSGVSWSVILHNPAEGAFDGGKFLKVTPGGSGAEGIYFDIPETEPAYGFLTGKNVTLAGWLRKPEGTSGTVTAQLGVMDNSGLPVGNTIHTLNESWQFCTQTLAIPAGTDFGDGIRRLRFGILEGTVGQATPFHVDGVNLTVGNKAMPPTNVVTWTNTQHNKLQTRAFVPEELFGYDSEAMRLIVSNLEYDNLGRKKKKYLPFSKDCGAADCNPYFDKTQFYDSLAKANSIYRPGNPEGLPDAGNSAFTETEYEHDQQVTVLRTGKPGDNFDLNSGNTVETFYSGVTSLELSDLGQDYTNPNNKNMPRYAFQYAEDEDGHGALEWKNGFGQVLRTATSVTEDGGEQMVVTDNFYDARGNLVKVHPPASCRDREGLPSGAPNCVPATLFEYDDEDRLTKEIHPDAGVSRYFHDHLGRVRISQLAHQVSDRKFTITRYDALGRPVEVGIYSDPENLLGTESILRERARDHVWPPVNDQNYRINSVYFYDKMPAPVPSAFVGLDPDFRLYPDEQTGTFANTKSRLCAVITLQPAIEALSSVDADKVEEISSTSYRYDKFGRVLETYTYNGLIVNPAFKLQKSAVSYDHAGRISEAGNFDKAEDYLPARISRYSYDAQGRIREISDGAGSPLARYAYYPSNGLAKSVSMFADPTDSIVVRYTYHIHGGIDSMIVDRPSLGVNRILFTENLKYDRPTASGSVPSYSGNITQANYFLSRLSVRSDGMRQNVYTYDELKRLRRVAYEVLDGTSNSKDDEFDAVYGYDRNGRITYQRRASRAAQSVTSGGEYTFASGTNRLAFVAAGMADGTPPDRSGTQADPNFKYDAAGNMVQDNSKDMTVSYDYRGLPLAFSIKGSDQRLHQTVMRYDHTGARIGKIQFDQSAAASVQFIVDPDSDREREYPSMRAAYDDLRTKVALLNAHAGKVSIFVVYEESPYRVPTEAGLIRSLFMQDGQHTVSVSIQGVRFNSDEYWALIGGRKEMSMTSASYYSGVGNEIRQLGADIDVSPKVMTSLPQGLGRYQSGSSDKVFNLKNHLGTTVLAVPSNQGHGYSVFDHTAYGLENKLVAGHNGDEKVTEAFTGKELDEALSLNYFGARYYDPDLGLWISPDPARQFHSLYAYSPNPTNTIDPDGRQAKETKEALDNGEAWLNEIEKVNNDPKLQDINTMNVDDLSRAQQKLAEHQAKTGKAVAVAGGSWGEWIYSKLFYWKVPKTKDITDLGKKYVKKEIEEKIKDATGVDLGKEPKVGKPPVVIHSNESKPVDP